MGVPKHRKSHARGGYRRSHLAFKTTKPHHCPKCNAPIMSHCACSACGFYQGRQIFKTKTDIKLKREEKRKKKEQKEKERMQKLKNK